MQAVVASAYHLLPLRALIGFFVAGIVPSSQSMIVKSTEDAHRGGILGTIHSVSFMGQAIGPLLGGILGAFCGYRIPFVITSLALIFVSYGFRNSFKKDDPLTYEPRSEKS